MTCIQDVNIGLFPAIATRRNRFCLPTTLMAVTTERFELIALELSHLRLMRADGRSSLSRTRRSDDSLFWAWMCGSEAALFQIFMFFSAVRCADTRPSLNWSGWAEPTGNTGPVGSANMSDLTVQLRPARTHARTQKSAERINEHEQSRLLLCYLVCKIASLRPHGRTRHRDHRGPMSKDRPGIPTSPPGGHS